MGEIGYGHARVTSPSVRRPDYGASIAFAAVATLATNACTSAPLTDLCPSVSPGDLIITELRGAQSDADDGGQWVELHNRTTRPLNLEGLHVRMRKVDGSNEDNIIIRSSLTVPAGEFVVLAIWPELVAPAAYIDYVVGTDVAADLLDTAAVDVTACDTLVDRIVYGGLPNQGTYSLNPSADGGANDDASAWCTNETLAEGSNVAYGTPGEENPACP